MTVDGAKLYGLVGVVILHPSVGVRNISVSIQSLFILETYANLTKRVNSERVTICYTLSIQFCFTSQKDYLMTCELRLKGT